MIYISLGLRVGTQIRAQTMNSQETYDELCKLSDEPRFQMKTYENGEYYDHCSESSQNAILIKIISGQKIMVWSETLNASTNRCIKMLRNCDLWQVHDVMYKNLSLVISATGVINLDNIIAEYAAPDVVVLANGRPICIGSIDFYIPAIATKYTCYTIYVQKTTATKCSVKIKIKKMIIGSSYMNNISKGLFMVGEKLIVYNGMIGKKQDIPMHAPRTLSGY